MSKTFWFACASAIAMLIVVVVLPSFGVEDEITMVLHPFFITENIMFVLMLLYASSTLNLREGSISMFFKSCRDVEFVLADFLLLFFAIIIHLPSMSC